MILDANSLLNEQGINFAEQGILAGEQGVYRPKLKSSPEEIFGTKSLWEMSALPPKGDLCIALANVRFVPIADILSPARNDLVRSR